MKGDTPEGGYASDEDPDPRPSGVGEPGMWQTTGHLLIPLYVALLVALLTAGVMMVIRNG